MSMAPGLAVLSLSVYFVNVCVILLPFSSAIWMILFCAVFSSSATKTERRKLPLLSSGIHWSAVYDPPNATATPTGAAAANTAYTEVLSNGLSAYQLGLTWDFFENTVPGVIDTTALELYLSILASSNLVPIVGLNVINTVTLSIPSDLKDSSDSSKLANGMDFMSEAFRTRYYAFLNATIPLIAASNGFYVVLANEFDGYLPSQSSLYQTSFTEFILDASDYVHNVLGYDQLATGVTVMHGGLSDLPGTTWFDMLLANVDIMSVTYYPLQSDFQVEHPSKIAEDVQLIVDVLPEDMSIVIQEFGYPSGYLSQATNNSTQQKQAEFYRQCNAAFVALIEANRLRVASAFKLVDWSSKTCDEFAVYYGLDNAQFIEYLCTLGMFTYDGVQKEAYSVFLSMLQQSFNYDSYAPSMAPSISSEAPTTTTTAVITTELDSSSTETTMSATQQSVSAAQMNAIVLVSITCMFNFVLF